MRVPKTLPQDRALGPTAIKLWGLLYCGLSFAPWLKVTTICVVVALTASALNDLSYHVLDRTPAELRRLAHQGAWSLVLAILLLLSIVATVLGVGTRRLAPRLCDAVVRGRAATWARVIVLWLPLACVSGAVHALVATALEHLPAEPNEPPWVGATRIARLAEAGSLGWVAQPDLWPDADTDTRLDLRVARSNLALLALGDRWLPLVAPAKAAAPALIERRTAPQLERIVARLERKVGPLRQPYRDYKKAYGEGRERVLECERTIDRKVRAIGGGDKQALRAALRESPGDLATFEQEQKREYYRHGKTRVRGSDLPLFMNHDQFVAYWQPHLRRRGATSGYAHTVAMQRIEEQWWKYSRSNDNLMSGIHRRANQGREECRAGLDEQLRARGVKADMSEVDFVLAKAPAAEREDARALLAQTLYPALPRYGLKALRVRDLPFLEDRQAIRDRLHEHVRRLYDTFFDEEVRAAPAHAQEVMREVLGTALTTAAWSLALLCNLGVLLAIGIAAAHRRISVWRSLALQLLVPGVLLAAFSVGASPFSAGGALDASFDELARGDHGLGGRAYATAIRAERTTLFLSAVLCKVPGLYCRYQR